MKRLLLFLVSKLKSIFKKNIAFSAQVEYSTVSNKSKIWGKCKLFHSSIGDYTYVGRETRIIHTDIGKFCSIAGSVNIGMGNHTLDNLSTSPIFTEANNGTSNKWVSTTNVDPYKKISIGNDVWIGTRAMIMGGVKIGDGVVIGAGSIVTKDIPPYAIVAGVPAKIIRYRFPNEIIEKLEIIKWWDFPECILKENICLFQRTVNDDSILALSKFRDSV